MKKVAILLCLFISFQVFGWGLTGHRVVGEIAERHLTKKAKKALREVMGSETLAEAANWMDWVKSDKSYNHMSTWHYVTIPAGETYDDIEKEPKGDIIASIERMVLDLKSGTLSKEDEIFTIRSLTHLVGDIHQPLHVGQPGDRGGNDVKVKWFGSNTNIHSVWDSRMIDGDNLSYTEWSEMINHASKSQVADWQGATVRDWAQESMSLRENVYNLPESGSLSYRYHFDNHAIVRLRLLQAGVRLAGIMNEVYN